MEKGIRVAMHGIGTFLVVTGVMMYSVPAGLVTAGLILIMTAQRSRKREQAAKQIANKEDE